MIAAADEWVAWKLGDKVPAPGEYVIMVSADGLPRTWSAICKVLPADNRFQDRFDWPYTSTIVAYLPRPLPAFEG